MITIKIHWWGFMFDNVSFDDAVKFYSRMSEEYVTIDKNDKKDNGFRFL